MIIGHQKILEFLKESAEADNLSHAYLFSGQEKLGKKKIALEFTSFLFGQPPTTFWKKVVGGKHPDFIFIEPEKKEIKISQIREAIWRLALKPSMAPYKVAIIDQAHCLNQEAQNCLLKTLEEPKGKAILFLITEYPEALFPTIRSRCQIIKFFPSRFTPKRASDLSRKIQDSRLISDLIKISNSDLVTRFQYAKIISQNSNLNEILNIWLSHFRKILLSKLKQNQKLSLLDINRLKEIQKINFLLSTTNVNPKLALEILMLEL